MKIQGKGKITYVRVGLCRGSKPGQEAVALAKIVELGLVHLGRAGVRLQADRGRRITIRALGNKASSTQKTQTKTG